MYSNSEILNQFSVLAGIGADFKLDGMLYIRVEGLFQLRFPSDYQRGLVNELDAFFAPIPFNFKPTYGMGPVIKVALGTILL